MAEGGSPTRRAPKRPREGAEDDYRSCPPVATSDGARPSTSGARPRESVRSDPENSGSTRPRRGHPRFGACGIGYRGNWHVGHQPINPWGLGYSRGFGGPGQGMRGQGEPGPATFGSKEAEPAARFGRSGHGYNPLSHEVAGPSRGRREDSGRMFRQEGPRGVLPESRDEGKGARPKMRMQFAFPRYQTDPDVQLKRSTVMDYQKFLCWKPASPFSLAVDQNDYEEFTSIIRTLHFEDYTDCVAGKTMVSYPITSKHHTSLDDGTRGLWYGIPKPGHNWFGNVGFKVNFSLFETCFLNMGTYEVYFLEVLQYAWNSATRLLVMSPLDPDLPDDVEEYDPLMAGGPWYKDANGNNLHLKTIRKFNQEFEKTGENHLEFFIKFSREDCKKLYSLGAVAEQDHSMANDAMPYKCRKYRFGPPELWQECPSEWHAHQAQDLIMENWEVRKLMLHRTMEKMEKIALGADDIIENVKIHLEVLFNELTKGDIGVTMGELCTTLCRARIEMAEIMTTGTLAQIQTKRRREVPRLAPSPYAGIEREINDGVRQKVINKMHFANASLHEDLQTYVMERRPGINKIHKEELTEKMLTLAAEKMKAVLSELYEDSREAVCRDALLDACQPPTLRKLDRRGMLRPPREAPPPPPPPVAPDEANPGLRQCESRIATLMQSVEPLNYPKTKAEMDLEAFIAELSISERPSTAEGEWMPTRSGGRSSQAMRTAIGFEHAPEMVVPSQTLVPEMVVPSQTLVPEMVVPSQTLVPEMVVPSQTLVPEMVVPSQTLVPKVQSQPLITEDMHPGQVLLRLSGFDKTFKKLWLVQMKQKQKGLRKRVRMLVHMRLTHGIDRPLYVLNENQEEEDEEYEEYEEEQEVGPDEGE